MNRYRMLLVSSLLLIAGVMAQAQQRTAAPQDGQTEEARRRGIQQLPPEAITKFTEVLGGLQAQRITPQWNTGAWWTNTALVTRLGLTDDQKTRVERAFENHRQTLTTNTEQLTKEEAQLRKLLDADSIDRNAILTQIDRVIQARGELERTNSAMTLEMREVLTRAQWAQLPQAWPAPAFYMRTAEGVGIVPGAPGVRGAGGRGTPGQRSGGAGQRQQ